MATRYCLIICTCTHKFWRAHPANPKTLRPWTCPRNRGAVGEYLTHETRCSTVAEQMREVNDMRLLASAKGMRKLRATQDRVDAAAGAVVVPAGPDIDCGPIG